MALAIPQLECPPSVKTAEGRLRCAIRMQQLQMDVDALNLNVLRDKGLTGKCLERERWNFIVAQRAKKRPISKEICRLRPIVFPDRLHWGPDSGEVDQSHVLKLEARADKRFDAGLKGHPLLVVPKIQVEFVDPYEDFDTYTEVDIEEEPLPGRLDVSGNTATWTALDRNEGDVYLWKARPTAGDFTHLGVAEWTATLVNSMVSFGGYADEVEDCFNNNDWAGWLFYQAGGNNIYIAQYKNTGIQDFDHWAGAALNVPYYVTWDRAGSTVTADIYTGGHGGVFKDRLVMDDDGVDRAYAMAMSSREHVTGGKDSSGSFQEWDWQEATGIGDVFGRAGGTVGSSVIIGKG